MNYMFIYIIVNRRSNVVCTCTRYEDVKMNEPQCKSRWQNELINQSVKVVKFYYEKKMYT